MGELSQSIGKKLENFGSMLFTNLEWEILAQNLQIECTRTSHKSVSSGSEQKTTHGIDILQGFYNPFTSRNEAAIIECKNHLWKDFIPSNLNSWIEELVNTIECAACSPTVSPYTMDYTLNTGILLFNSSDNLYDLERAHETLSKVNVPNGLHPYNYLKHIFETMPSKMDGTSRDFIRDLMPWSNKLPDKCRVKKVELK